MAPSTIQEPAARSPSAVGPRPARGMRRAGKPASQAACRSSVGGWRAGHGQSSHVRPRVQSALVCVPRPAGRRVPSSATPALHLRRLIRCRTSSRPDLTGRSAGSRSRWPTSPRRPPSAWPSTAPCPLPCAGRSTGSTRGGGRLPPVVGRAGRRGLRRAPAQARERPVAAAAPRRRPRARSAPDRAARGAGARCCGRRPPPRCSSGRFAGEATASERRPWSLRPSSCRHMGCGGRRGGGGSRVHRAVRLLRRRLGPDAPVPVGPARRARSPWPRTSTRLWMAGAPWIGSPESRRLGPWPRRSSTGLPAGSVAASRASPSAAAWPGRPPCPGRPSPRPSRSSAGTRRLGIPPAPRRRRGVHPGPRLDGGPQLAMNVRTVGHGAHPQEELVRLLSNAGVDAVVDVRGTPAAAATPSSPGTP